MDDYKIDFVVTWVDGTDKKWQNKKREFDSNYHNDNDEFNTVNRYRELGLFKYWFRSVEEFAPWVNHIFIVTDQQIPEFLDLSHKKITIIDHKEIIDENYLPTFNSSAIELNIHKIPGLSENYVYFNDDMYLTQKVSKKDFFYEKNIVRDTISQSVIIPTENYDHIIVNNVKLLNKHYSKKRIIKENFWSFFSIKQGYKFFLINSFLILFPKFTRLHDPHTAYSMIKKDVIDALSISEVEVADTMNNKTRGLSDISIQWLRYYMIANKKARFRSHNFSRASQSNDTDLVTKIFHNSTTKIMCLQDDLEVSERDILALKQIFERKYPQKSTYEI